MAIGHIAVRTHKRSAGHSAAAVLAYRHGTALVCPRTGEIHDYTRRSGVARCGTVAAVDTPLTQSLDALVAGIEGAERRRDSRISRDVQVALPCELSEPQNYELTQAFAKALAKRYHTLASWAVHRPHRNDDGDPRNVHAHIVIPTRALDETGQLGRKLVELDHPKQSRDEIKAIRLLWEETANAALIEAGVSARVDVGRREDGDPAPTLGPTHAAVERKARRQLGHRTTGVPVAELVTDGQSVTGRGRRLEKHERRRRRRRVREQNTATRLLTPNEGLSDAGEVVLESLEATPEPELAPSPAVRAGQVFGVTTAVRAVPEDELAPSPAVRAGQVFGATTAVRAVPKPECVPPPAVRSDQALGATTAVRAAPKPERVPPPAVRSDQALGATTAVRAAPKPERVPPPAVRSDQALGATTAVRAAPKPEAVPPPVKFWSIISQGWSTGLDALRREVELLNAKIERLRNRERRQRAPQPPLTANAHGLPPTPEDLQAARQWLTRTVGPSQHGTSIPTVADSIARQRLTANVSLHESHPQRYSERPTLPKAISQLAPRAAPGYTGNAFGPIPDRMNTGACRTEKGAEQAAQVLDRAIDDIAREHFDGHTDPRDYRPRWFVGRPLDEAKRVAMDAWQSIQETIIERMVSAAERPEADEIIRRRLKQERKRLAEKAQQRLARERRSQRNERPERDQGGESVPQRQNENKGPGFGH